MTLEVALGAARSGSAGGAAVCSWRTEKAVEEERKMDPLKQHGLQGYPGASHGLGVRPMPTAQVWRRSRRMVRIRCLIRIAVGWKVLSERSKGKPTKKDQARGVQFGSMS